MTSRKRKIEDALARIAEANGVKEITMTHGKFVPLIRQIESQFPATLPPDDYQFEFIFSVKLDYRDWQMVLAALAAAPSVPAEPHYLERWMDAQCQAAGYKRWFESDGTVIFERPGKPGFLQAYGPIQVSVPAERALQPRSRGEADDAG